MNDIVFCCVCICVTVLLISVLIFIYAFFKQECYSGFKTAGRRLSDIHDYIMYVRSSVNALGSRVDKLSKDMELKYSALYANVGCVHDAVKLLRKDIEEKKKK